MTSLHRNVKSAHETRPGDDAAEWARLRALVRRRHRETDSVLARILSAATTVGAIVGIVALTRGCSPYAELPAARNVVRAALQADVASPRGPVAKSGSAVP